MQIYTVLLLALAGTSSPASRAAPPPPLVSDGVVFEHQAPLNGGSVVIQLPNDGQYVYRTQQAEDAPADRRVFMIGRPTRQEFKFLSLAEQSALWRYREDRRIALAAERQAEAQAAIRAAAVRPASALAPAAPTRSRSRIVWPRVVLRDGEICVPRLAFSEAVDWRDHLTCSTEGASDVRR